MKTVASAVLLIAVALGACSDDQPVSEHDFYSAVVECTEARTGVDYGEMPEDANGLTTTVGQRTINAALDAAFFEYTQCFDELLQEMGPASG